MVTNGLSPLMRAIKDGMDIPEESFVFSISPDGFVSDGEGESEYRSGYITNGVAALRPTSRKQLSVLGNVVVVTEHCVDVSLWKLGGASVALRLVEMASVSCCCYVTADLTCKFASQNPHELSRTLGIFAESTRSSWQMSEDMERLRTLLSLCCTPS